MGKFNNFWAKVKTFLSTLKERAINGYKWVGTDGLLNFETSALLVILFIVFFPVAWSAALAFILVTLKCSLDKTRGKKGELHDFICAIIGVLTGVILASVCGVPTFF
jgi:hypothetical protein